MLHFAFLQNEKETRNLICTQNPGHIFKLS